MSLNQIPVAVGAFRVCGSQDSTLYMVILNFGRWMFGPCVHLASEVLCLYVEFS